MRFFSGTRDMSQKKGAASERYKQELNAKNNKGGLAKEDPNAVYKRQIEARMAKMMEDILLGKKTNMTKLPGTKGADEGPPKEVSKSTLMMLRLLAERREQKERKVMRKRENAFKAEQRAKVNLAKQQQMQADLLIAQKEEEYKSQQATKNVSFWGTPLDDNGGWW